MKMKTISQPQRMSTRTKAIEYAYPSSTFGGQDGRWYVAIYANALATEPIDYTFAETKERAKELAERLPEPYCQYRNQF